MRLLISILLLFFSVQSFGQGKQKIKGKPTTLEETYIYLDQMFDDTTKYGFMTLPEDVSTGRLHRGLGMWIRNNWGLWKDSKLKHYFLERGIGHPDNMSSIILTSFHRHLNNKPIDLDGQIKKHQDFYKGIIQHGDTFIYPKELFKDQTSDSALVNFFPIGDTILVSVYTTYTKWFRRYYSSINATAVVKEHRTDKLFIEIIAMEISPKKKTQVKVGDKFEEGPMYCSLLPPRGWTYKKP